MIKKLPISHNWQEALSLIFIAAAALFIAFFTKAYILQPYIVDGQSMETTLQNHDRLLVDKLPKTVGNLRHHPYTPERGDIIVFNQSGLPGYIGSKQLIKRVIGLPGERIVIRDGKITVFNHSRPKGFNPDTGGSYRIDSDYTQGSTDQTLGPSEIFVCGDNRNNSEDSRYFGPVVRDKIVGKLSLRIYPFDKVQRF